MKNQQANKTMISDPNIHIPPPKINNAPLVSRGGALHKGPHHPSRLESLVYASKQKPMSRLERLAEDV
jgi:hypothetical protein